MNKILKTGIVVGLLFAAPKTFGAVTGYITPTQLVQTILQVVLIDSTGKKTLVTATQFQVTFNKSDTDLATTNLQSVSIQAGRYIGASLTYARTMSVKSDGDTYQGKTGTSLSHGQALCSDGGSASGFTPAVLTNKNAAACTPNSLAISDNGTALPTDTTTATMYFSSPVCVTTSASTCKTGDTVFLADTSPPAITLYLDLYNLVGIDADTAAYAVGTRAYPNVMLGTPAAAFHLNSNDAGTTMADVTLLFDSSKNLLYSSAATIGTTKVCSGTGTVTVTANSASGFVNTSGPSWVQGYDTSNTGRVQFAAGASSGSGSSVVYNSSGMNTVTSLLQAVGQTATISCVADSAADPAYLNFTYKNTPTAPSSSGTQSISIKKIVDSANIFEVCATSPCGAYP